jgi:hypothetical protein
LGNIAIPQAREDGIFQCSFETIISTDICTVNGTLALPIRAVAILTVDLFIEFDDCRTLIFSRGGSSRKVIARKGEITAFGINLDFAIMVGLTSALPSFR